MTRCALEQLSVIAPHYISEDKSDMRGIKPGWYAIEATSFLDLLPAARRSSWRLLRK